MDPIDYAQEIEQRDRQLALRAHHDQAAAQAEGNGTCVACREPIDPKRLAVLPKALRCIECESNAERQRSQYRRGAL